MNKNKYKSYLFAIVAAAFAAVTISACNKPSGELEYDSVISIFGDKVVSLDAVAGEHVLEYAISGASQGLESTVTPSADWLGVVSAADEAPVEAKEDGSGTESVAPKISSVKVRYEANKTSEDRTAKLVFSVSGAKDVAVTFLQKANPDYKLNTSMKISLEVNDVDETSAMVTVAPNAESYYFYRIVTAETFESFTDKDAFIDSQVDALRKAAQEYADKYEKPYSLEGYLYKGYRANTVKGFDPDSEYCLVAFAMSLAGEYSRDFEMKKFHTKALQKSSDDFAFTFSSDKSTLKVVPFDKASDYYIVITTKSVWDKYKTPKACIEAYMGSYEPESFRGETEVRTGISEEGDYLLLVFGYDSGKEKITTGITYALFHYGE